MNQRPPTISSAKLRRALYLIALAALLGAALVSGGCNNQLGTGNKPQGNNNAKPCDKEEIRSGSDEPIIITGGSTDLDFHPQTFENPVAGGFSNVPYPPADRDSINLDIVGMNIYDDGENGDPGKVYRKYDLPSGNVVITLHTRGSAPAGHFPPPDRDIIIKDAAPNVVNILFDVDTFKFRLRRHYFHRRYRVRDFEITRDGNNVKNDCRDGDNNSGVTCDLPAKFSIEVVLRRLP